MKTIASMLCAALASMAALAKTSTPEGWLDDYDAALKKAAAENRHVVVDFSGSDWCGWCKRLDKEVFATDAFRKAAAEKYVLLMVDSPNDQSLLTEKAAKENPELVEKFRVRGFPTVVVLDPKGEEVCRLGYERGGPEKYVEKLDAEIRDAPDVKKYIKPIEDVLNRYDDQMEKELRAAMEKVKEKFPDPKHDLSKAAQKKLQRQAMKYAQQVMFDEVYSRYVPLYEKSFAEAKEMKVPENMEERKKELIEEQEGRFDMLREALKAYEEAKKNGTLDEEDEEGDDDDDDDDEMPRRHRPTFVSPKPEDAHTDAEFFEKVAMPFYTKHIVETYDASSETNAEVRARVLRVRESLARHLAYLDFELYPELDRAADARWLWKNGCRDAAVGLYLYDSGSADDKFWKWKERLADVAAKHDVTKEPILGMILRRKCYHRAEEHHGKWPKHRPDSVVKAAYADFAESFNACTGILAAADCRIAEWMDISSPLPVGSGAKLGNRYLELCQRAAACKHAAFAARGEGWASEVSEEGWKGWEANNREAESNLLEAAALKPDRARPAMMLADLYGRSCGSGDPIAWFNKGVSNSLDEATWFVSGALQFQTSRWGGSTDLLIDVATNAAANVCTSSRFAYITAASVVGKMLEYEYEGGTRTNVYRSVFRPELTAALYRMFDAYIAADNKDPALGPDFFRTTALTLAVEARDWDRARAYYDAIKKGIVNDKSLEWVWRATASAETVNMWTVMMTLGRRRCGRELLDAEQAMDEGRFADAYAYYGKMCERKDLSERERALTGGRAFASRKSMQEAQGGWVDLMPNRCGGDTWNHWNDIVLGDDGRVRLKRGNRCHALAMVSVPGIGSEFEATVHFEKGKPDQKAWDIGWGWARPFRCNQSAWAYPYLYFTRDEKGDHFAIDSWTEENKELKAKNDANYWDKNRGKDPLRRVCSVDLEPADSHSFRAVFGEKDFTVEVDGRQVYTRPMDDLLSVDYQSDRVQYPSGDVMPTWKVYEGCAFSGYRYRRVPAKEK